MTTYKDMESSVKTVKLSSGSEMPVFGLGTYHIEKAGVVYKAIELGYRMFDCASFYKNEEAVGAEFKQAFDAGLVKREDLFIVSKVWWDEVSDCDAAIKRSLKKLGVEYLDLYLVHWPIAVDVKEVDGKTTYERRRLPMYKVWEQMEALVDAGLTRSIGTSNFNLQMLWDMMAYCKHKPSCNEVELHPLNA